MITLLKITLHKIVSKFLDKYLNSKNHDIQFARNFKSLFETIQYIHKNMLLIKPVDQPLEIHDIALSHVTLNGFFLEFGVFSGKTINYISNKVNNELIYGFDSFEGLPDFWRDGFDKGTFDLKSNLPNVNLNVKLIKGWFDESLKDFKLNKPIAYLHIDCDLYSSTKTIFNYLRNHIISGTVIVFDEYFNYPGWQNGEYLAFKEFIDSTKLHYEYLSYTRNHEQVAIIIK